jgi:glutamine synthetase
VLSELAAAYRALGLPLRSIENEWGPGQVECTFTAQPALSAADDLLLFRTATRQLCRRLGYFATFMCRPALKGHYPSGWHLHQSLAARGSRRNLFVPAKPADLLSPLGLQFAGGLLEHAVASTVFATPTVNGYRRFRPNSLAPDRVTWGHDHRGALLRVTGRPGAPDTRLENRLGEPAANPYLYLASQIVAGLDGVERRLDPGPPETDPYQSARPRLPASLGEALDALERDALFRRELGEVFVDYFVRLKRSEDGRFRRYLEENGLEERPEETTAWEHNEYYDFF